MGSERDGEREKAGYAFTNLASENEGARNDAVVGSSENAHGTEEILSRSLQSV